jgi:hypothetical protein
MVYDIFAIKKRKKNWLDIFNVYFFLRIIVLVTTGVVILYYRFKVMHFEGPTFTSIDNPAAYADNIYIRVKFSPNKNFSLSFLLQIFSYNYTYFINFLLLLWPQWLCFDWSMGCIPLIESVYDARIAFVLIFWIIGIFSIYTIAAKVIETRIL